MYPYWNDHWSEEAPWWLSEDTERIESLTRSVSLGQAVMFHGEPGAGQDEFSWRVANRLGSQSGLLELSCPPDAASTASLAALAETPPINGHVLLIPDVATFTGPDVEVVAGLVHRNHVLVVAAVSDTQGAPAAPLAQLIKFERIRVRQLSHAAGTAYLENGLGGPISERAAYAVWDGASGNRAMMRMITADWRESDYLVCEDAVWVLRSSDPPAGQRLGEYWRRWLGNQSLGVRDVFEFLALAGELPLSVLLKLCGGNAVDAVHDLGYLGLRESTGREVGLRGLVSSPAIRAQVPPGRSRQLLDRVTEFVDRNGLHRPPGLVSWRLNCGLAVQPARYIEGAEYLLTLVSPTDALRMLNAVPDEVDSDRVSTIRISALLAAGQFVDLRSQIGSHRPDTSVQESGTRRLSSVPKDGDVKNCGRDDVGGLSTTELLEASWRGDFKSLLGQRASNLQLIDEVSWLGEQVVHEALVLTGQVCDGLQRDRELVHALEQSGIAPFLVQRGRLGLFDLECLAGEWRRASTTLDGGSNASPGTPGQHNTGSLYKAISLVLKGEYASSCEVLRREVPQLRMLGRYDLLPLAYSLYALALACTGRQSLARSALAAAEVSGEQGGGVWRLAWAAEFFSAQAMGYVGRVEAAVMRLMDAAERDHVLGNHAQALLTLSAAVQWGHEPALGLMEASAGRSDGRFAESCVWVARGLRTGDIEELEYGALLARSLGQHFFADYAQQQLESLNGPCPKMQHQAVQASADGRRAASRDDILLLLPPRQRAIVYHVLADRSNGVIASTLGLSVRTVESHLYQAYAKLNVRNRAELRAEFTGHNSVPGSLT